MKVRVTYEYRTYEVYDTIEINPEDYPELEGMSEDDAVKYINENIYEFKIKDSNEESIIDTAMFEKDIVRDKTFDGEHKVVLVNE